MRLLWQVWELKVPGRLPCLCAFTSRISTRPSPWRSGKIPACSWLGEGKRKYCEICPGILFLARVFSGETLLPEPNLLVISEPTLCGGREIAISSPLYPSCPTWGVKNPKNHRQNSHSTGIDSPKGRDLILALSNASSCFLSTLNVPLHYKGLCTTVPFSTTFMFSSQRLQGILKGKNKTKEPPKPPKTKTKPNKQAKNQKQFIGRE